MAALLGPLAGPLVGIIVGCLVLLAWTFWADR